MLLLPQNFVVVLISFSESDETRRASLVRTTQERARVRFASEQRSAHQAGRPLHAARCLPSSCRTPVARLVPSAPSVACRVFKIKVASRGGFLVNINSRSNFNSGSKSSAAATAPKKWPIGRNKRMEEGGRIVVATAFGLLPGGRGSAPYEPTRKNRRRASGWRVRLGMARTRPSR